MVLAIAVCPKTLQCCTRALLPEISSSLATPGELSSLVLSGSTGFLPPAVGVGLSSFSGDSTPSRLPSKSLGGILFEMWDHPTHLRLDCRFVPSGFSTRLLLRGPELLADYLNVGYHFMDLSKAFWCTPLLLRLPNIFWKFFFFYFRKIARANGEWTLLDVVVHSRAYATKMHSIWANTPYDGWAHATSLFLTDEWASVEFLLGPRTLNPDFCY